MRGWKASLSFSRGGMRWVTVAHRLAGTAQSAGEEGQEEEHLYWVGSVWLWLCVCERERKGRLCVYAFEGGRRQYRGTIVGWLGPSCCP